MPAARGSSGPRITNREGSVHASFAHRMNSAVRFIPCTKSYWGSHPRIFLARWVETVAFDRLSFKRASSGKKTLSSLLVGFDRAAVGRGEAGALFVRRPGDAANDFNFLTALMLPGTRFTGSRSGAANLKRLAENDLPFCWFDDSIIVRNSPVVFDIVDFVPIISSYRE